MSTAATLPIHEVIPALRRALTLHRLVVLQAPPGAGKSTSLPLSLLGEPWLAGQQIIMLQPRRVAARAVAARLAEGLGKSPGRGRVPCALRVADLGQDPH
ncbi:hypothetical protein ACFSC4_02090 [Deinococcus malanensis]|uniref:hypothetical protein n=1 Tax=Deinococcus malanensis TaxID=1706855 RepID=UPI003626E548